MHRDDHPSQVGRDVQNSDSEQPSEANSGGHEARSHGSRLRFLLVWPIVTAYRRKVRQSLSWRLAGSHHSTVLLTLFLIGFLIFGLAVGFTLHEAPILESPDEEARVAAQTLRQAGIDSRSEIDTLLTEALLDVMVSGSFIANSDGVTGPGFRFDNEVVDEFSDLSSISIVGSDGVILVSSDPALAGRSAAEINPGSAAVAAAANAGMSRSDANIAEDPDVPARDSGVIQMTYGSFPLRGDDGQVIGAVVVAKETSLIPEGSNLLIETVVGVIAGGLFFIFLFSIPALPAAAFLGIRRARAISRPIKELARAAGQLASGDMRVRVQIKGEDEIADLGTSFNRMADRLESSMATEVAARGRAEQLLAANRDLVANVSHELRTPVALIRGHLEALEADPEHSEDYTRIALRETDRLERLVNDLFQLVRLENHIIKLEREPIDAGSVVREAVESLVEPTRRTAGITMKAVVEPGDLTCLGDRARIVQVLQNLIRNAIRFTHEGGIILAGARAEGERIVLYVQDTGIGIAPADLPHVFDRFYRSEQSRSRSGGGAGLGLAIARQLVEQMGGELAVTSDIGEGSIFTITLQRPQPATNANGTVIQTAGVSAARR